MHAALSSKDVVVSIAGFLDEKGVRAVVQSCKTWRNALVPLLCKALQSQSLTPGPLVPLWHRDVELAGRAVAHAQSLAVVDMAAAKSNDNRPEIRPYCVMW